MLSRILMFRRVHRYMKINESEGGGCYESYIKSEFYNCSSNFTFQRGFGESVVLQLRLCHQTWKKLRVLVLSGLVYKFKERWWLKLWMTSRIFALKMILVEENKKYFPLWPMAELIWNFVTFPRFMELLFVQLSLSPSPR